MSFGNPLGWLALLGIPAVVFIHLLQVRSRRVRVSTLFLLDPSGFERKGGRKLDRLRRSPLLWIQLVSVLVATWLLVEPRWLREDTTLNVVLVVDGSASMSAYRGAAEEALASYRRYHDAPRTAAAVDPELLDQRSHHGAADQFDGHADGQLHRQPDQLPVDRRLHARGRVVRGDAKVYHVDFGDEIGLINYATSARREDEPLDESGLEYLDPGDDLISDNYTLIDQIQRRRQAAHWTSTTALGDGIKKGRELLEEQRRYGARPVLLVMTDGNANVREQAAWALGRLTRR